MDQKNKQTVLTLYVNQCVVGTFRLRAHSLSPSPRHAPLPHTRGRLYNPRVHGFTHIARCDGERNTNRRRDSERASAFPQCGLHSNSHSIRLNSCSSFPVHTLKLVQHKNKKSGQKILQSAPTRPHQQISGRPEGAE